MRKYACSRSLFLQFYLNEVLECFFETVLSIFRDTVQIKIRKNIKIPMYAAKHKQLICL